MICSRCNAQITNSADTFCNACGAPVQPVQRPIMAAAPPPVYRPADVPSATAATAATVTPVIPVPQQNAPPKKKNSALLIVLLLLLIAAAAFSVWYFVLRDWNAADKGTQQESVWARDTGDTASAPSATRDTEPPPVRESGQVIRLPGIFGGGVGVDQPGSTPEPAESPEPVPEPEPPPVTAPPEVMYPPPVFQHATASDITDSPTGRNYTPEQALDGHPDTAWNVPGTGDVWIALEADTEQYVSGMRILNGYTKYSPEYKTWLYYRNHRPQHITLFFSDGSYLEWTLEDIFDEDNYLYQDITFDAPMLTSYILIYVDSVYEGDRWDDTCISEIEVY